MSKKQSGKYQSENFFAVNTGKNAKGHPQYVFGQKNGRYKSYGLTTHPNKTHEFVRLSKNPNPKDSSTAYIQKGVFSTKLKYLSNRKTGWSFGSEDRALVQHWVKKYRRAHKK